MTDMVQGTGQGVDTPVSPVEAPAATAASIPASSPAEERLFRQSEVTEIVKREKHNAIESLRKMAVEQPAYLQQKYPELTAQRNQQQQIQQNSAQNAGFTADDVRRMAAEESQRLRDEWIGDAQRKAQEHDAQRIVSEFLTKLSTGKDKYQDFEQITGDVDFVKFPNAIQLANNFVDNTADVIYELGKDRTKLAVLEQLANMSPRDAVVQIQRLSKSIKDNHESAKAKIPNEPLSQMRPSNTGADSGVMSVSDFRKKYKG